MTLLAISAWLPWAKLFARTVSGISGDGKIVFGTSVLIGIAVAVTSRITRFWSIALLVAAAWGTISVLWMGSLLYKMSTLLDENLTDNPFAAMFSGGVSPGIGLYLAVFGGLLVCGGFGYEAYRQFDRGKSWLDHKNLIGVQVCAVVAGLLLGVFNVRMLIPAGEARKSRDGAVNPIAKNALSNIGADFKESERKNLQADLEKLEKKKKDSEEAAKQLKNFRVLRSRFYIEKGRFSEERIIELTVENSTRRAVSRAYFSGTLQTPGRAVPWMKGKINYEISGGLEPGEQAEWKLNPGMFSDWSHAEEKPGMKLDVEVIRLDGPDGKAFLEADFDDDDQKKLDSIKEELADLK